VDENTEIYDSLFTDGFGDGTISTQIKNAHQGRAVHEVWVTSRRTGCGSRVR
jgi:hypothetical protein